MAGAGCAQLLPPPKQEPLNVMPTPECYQRQLTTNRKLPGMVVVQAAVKPPGDTIQLESIPIKFVWADS